MGLVTDVYWECPGCGTKNKAQVYGEWDDPEEFHRKHIPISRGLKWNPPCECGQYKLENPPEMYVEYPIKRLDLEDG